MSQIRKVRGAGWGACCLTQLRFNMPVPKGIRIYLFSLLSSFVGGLHADLNSRAIDMYMYTAAC